MFVLGGGDLLDQFLSDEFEEEFVGFFINDLDSEILDDFMESQELEFGFVFKFLFSSVKFISDFSMINLNLNNMELMSLQINIWLVDFDSLVYLSFELLSFFMILFGQNFRLEVQNSRITERDEAELVNCEEVVQGKKEVFVFLGKFVVIFMIKKNNLGLRL